MVDFCEIPLDTNYFKMSVTISPKLIMSKPKLSRNLLQWNLPYTESLIKCQWKFDNMGRYYKRKGEFVVSVRLEPGTYEKFLLLIKLKSESKSSMLRKIIKIELSLNDFQIKTEKIRTSQLRPFKQITVKGWCNNCVVPANQPVKAYLDKSNLFYRCSLCGKTDIVLMDEELDVRQRVYNERSKGKNTV